MDLRGKYLLEIPERLQLGLRKIPDRSDRERVLTALFWGFVDVLSTGLDSNYLSERFRQGYSDFAHNFHLEPLLEQIKEKEAEELEYDLLYSLFEDFSHFMDLTGNWVSTAESFAAKFDIEFITNEDEYELEFIHCGHYFIVDVF